MTEEQKALRLQMIKDAHERILDKKRLKEIEGEKDNGTEYRDNDQYEYQHAISTYDYE